jgi:hypothetical protein
LTIINLFWIAIIGATDSCIIFLVEDSLDDITKNILKIIECSKYNNYLTADSAYCTWLCLRLLGEVGHNIINNKLLIK